MVRWPSGLRRTLGKRVNTKSVTRVRIPSSLQVFVITYLFKINHIHLLADEFGKAKSYII